MRYSPLLLLGSLACQVDLAPIDPALAPCAKQADCDSDSFCDRGFCFQAVCRLDGLLLPGEACDDGNTDASDGCTDECVLARCGDGILRQDLAPGEAGYEACDDGNQQSDDHCLNNCTLARCGDGVLRHDLRPGQQDFEACDDGNLDNADGCTNGCALARCGDGYLRAGLEPADLGYEDCDDGDEDNFDDCSNACRQARCGDGLRRTDLEPGDRAFESCDDGNHSETDACLSSCEWNRCGDGHQDPEQEDCDDGNDAVDDGCINCTLARCGDGIRRTDLVANDPNYEDCDDGNDVETDPCLSNCRAARCGDGVIRLDFQSRLEPGFEDCEPERYDGDEDCSSWCHEMPPPPQLAIGRGHHCVLSGGEVYCAGHVQARATGGGWVAGPSAYGLGDVEGLRFATATGYIFLCYTNAAGFAVCWDMETHLDRWRPVAAQEPLVDMVKNLQRTLSCSLARSGRVRCAVGADLQNQPVDGLGVITRLSNSGDLFCGIDRDGAASCWGQDLVPSPLENMPPLRAVVTHLQDFEEPPTEFAHVLTQAGQVLSYPAGRAADSIPGTVIQLRTTDRGSAICALTAAGTVYCKGYAGPHGLLGGGQGNGFLASEFMEVRGLSDVVEIRGGASRFCALTDSGQLWCWGRTPRLSDGYFPAYENHSVPVAIPGFPIAAP